MSASFELNEEVALPRDLDRDDESPDQSPSVASEPAATARNEASRPAEMPSATRSDVAVQMSEVTYTYEGAAAPVVVNASLTVRDGEFVLILGPSGCGKSTLLQMLNGTIPHTLKGTLTGDITVCDLPIATTKVANFATEVGMVFQDPDAQIINTRVRDEVCFALENLCRPPAEILTAQAEALGFVGLAEFGDRSIFDLSGGQKQRVSIAAVLAARPRLLVLDEPTANLDPAGMAEIFAVLERLNREHGTTIVMVEHRVDELADRVSRVVMMDQGSIIFDGTPRAAFAKRRTAHSEEADTVPTSAWFPQAAEFALALSDRCGVPIDPGRFPLNVAEAVAYAVPQIGPAPKTSSVDVAEDKTGNGAAASPIVKVTGLDYAYERGTPVLRDISFELHPGKMIALCGRNGSGKTTLARLLMHINPPPKGAILLDGKDVAGLSARDIASRIGYVFQNPDHQFVTEKVWDEVAYGLRVRDYADYAVKERVEEVLEIVDLKRYADRSPFALSLGERRRLSVATMLVLEPRILVLDEPTIGQDYERAQQLMGLMARLRERHATTILMITHDVRLVAEWADRAMVISGGRLLFDGAPLHMFSDPALLGEAGLLVPPVFEISRMLADAKPGSPVAPTLSVADLTSAIAESRLGP
jgi:energy-coupling factor transporter ATP-binding protein EcfA2